MKVLNLTHPITTNMPIWPGDPQIIIDQAADRKAYGYYMNKVSFGEHSGTHIGTPAHFHAPGRTVDQLLPAELIVPGIKIDISVPCAHNPDYLLTVQDIRDWQELFGTVPQGSVCLVATGWSQYWTDTDRYFGSNDNRMHFPGISVDAMHYLIDLGICGMGIDTAGIDGGLSDTFASNKLAAQHDCYHLENIADMSELPCTGFTLYIGALPIENGSGSPCRLLATLPD